MTAALAVGMLAGCGNSDSEFFKMPLPETIPRAHPRQEAQAHLLPTQQRKRKLPQPLPYGLHQRIRASDSGEWLQTMCNQFAEEHPSWHITFDYGVCAESDAKRYRNTGR